MQQTQLQLQQHLQLHHHQQRAASLVDYSNSPASPMASPTGCSGNSFVEQQPPMEGVGSEVLHHKAAMEDFRGLLETAVNDSRSGHSLARFNDKLANATQLKFFKEGWQMRNFFGEQPKSPTETPPEMEETIMSPSMERVENRAEMKNLATLCSAAAMAAQVTAANKEIDEIVTDIESDEGEADGEENTLPPEPIELTDTIIEEEVVDDEDDDEEEDPDTQSGEIDKLNFDDDDADAEVDYIDEDDGNDDDDGGDDDDEDEDEFFLDVNVAVGDQSDTNSKSGAALRPKLRKMSTRLENLILTKPDVLSQSLCDFRQDLSNSELIHMLPIKAAAANNAALNSLLQQQLAAAVHAKAHSQQQQDTEQCGNFQKINEITIIL